jgi:phage terminase small subunit
VAVRAQDRAFAFLSLTMPISAKEVTRLRKDAEMPRISAEARAAAVWRTGGRPPRAPKHLSAGAKKVWQEIVAGYPDDYFQPGATILLEQLCTSLCWVGS